jgi:NADP-dependent 3-hydroxy acid dehydrogenase YdfG
MEQKVIAILGMGSGISLSVAHLFGEHGFKVAMFSRNEQNLQGFANELKAKKIKSYCYVANVGDERGLSDALKRAERDLGSIDVMFYNAAKLKLKYILDESSDSLADDFKINVGGALTATNTLVPGMIKRGKGSLLFTGGGFAVQPNADFGSLSLGKAALRSLTQLFRLALAGKPIQIASVIVCGMVSTYDERYNPNQIAIQFWECYQKGENEEVIY